MKRSFGLAGIAMAGLFVFSGCSKRGHEALGTGGTMSAVAAGKTINIPKCSASSLGNMYVIMGTWGTFSQIFINIKTSAAAAPAPLAATTYIIDSSGENITAEYMPSGVAYPAKSGSITITSINPGVNVTGSFDFILVDGTPVKGSFTAK